MVHEARYDITAISGRPNINGLTLYEAAKELIRLREEGRIVDATGIRRMHGGSYRFVAFFCEWRDTVRPAFAASDSERLVLEAWSS